MNWDKETDLVITNTLKSPRSAVWRCWSTPELFKQFYVPKPHSVGNCEMDIRTGGRFNITLVADGAEIPVNGTFLEVVEEEKLVFTDYYSEGWKPSPQSFMTCVVLFKDSKNGGTEYTVVARHTSAEERLAHEEMGFHKDWTTTAQQLDELAASLV